MFLLRVCNTLKKHKVPYAIVGGHAVSLHGAVRGTIDIDFVINWTKENLQKAQEAMESLGLISRIPIDANTLYDFKDEYIKKRNLIAWNFYNPINPTEQIDIIITFDLSKKKTVNKKIQSYFIKILDKEELIKMKKNSGRKQDLIDVEALKKL